MKEKINLCEKCLRLPDARKFCTACYHKVYFSPSKFKFRQLFNRCCFICGFQLTTNRSTVLLCQTCYNKVNARYLSWKRRTGWIPKKDIRFRDVMRSALWHNAPLVWEEDVRGLTFFPEGAKHRGEIRRVIDFHETRWIQRHKHENKVCPYCGGPKIKDRDTCFGCLRTSLRIQDRICNCGGFKSPQRQLCSACETGSTEPTLEELGIYEGTLS